MIKVRIQIASNKNYNFEYIFIGKRQYIEYDIRRYMRLLRVIKKLMEV